MSKTVPIGDDVRAVLARVVCTGRTVKIEGQLDRPLYEAVDKVLKALGGRWKRGKGHEFPEDAAPLIAAALGSGEAVDKKKTLGQFFTPPDLAREIVRSLPMLGKGVRVLEPSAGEGSLAIAAAETGARVTCVEVDPRLAGVLESYGYETIRNDFLLLNHNTHAERYDVVLMNPPFDRDSAIDHVNHALDFLKPGGLLVAIMPAGSINPGNRKRDLFAALVKSGTYTELPEGSFSESGTEVRTILVRLVKPKTAPVVERADDRPTRNAVRSRVQGRSL